MIFAVLGAAQLGTVSLWTDEGWDADLVCRDWAGMFAALHRGSVHPPLYHVMLKLWSTVFGTSILALRFPSLLFSLGTMLLILGPGRRRVGSRAACLTAFLLAFSSRFLIVTQEIRLYPMLCFIYTLAALSVANAVDRPGSRAVAGAAAALMLAMMADVWGVVLFLGVNGGIALLQWTRRHSDFPCRLWWGLQTVGAALILVGILYVCRRPQGVHELMYAVPFSAWRYLTVLYLFGSGGALPPASLFSPVVLGIVAALCVSLVGGALILWTGDGTSGRFVVAAAVLPWLATTAVYAATQSNLVTERRLSFTLPLLLMLAAVGLTEAARRSTAGRLLAGVALLVLFLSNAASTWNWETDPRFQRQDWRDATAWLARRIEPGDGVVLQNGYAVFVYRYYMGQSTPIYLLDASHVPDVAVLARRHRRLWLVSCQGYQVDPEQRIYRSLAAHCRSVDGADFENIPQPDARIVIVGFQCR